MSFVFRNFKDFEWINFKVDQALLFSSNNFWIFIDGFDTESNAQFNAEYVAQANTDSNQTESMQISV